MASEAVTSVTLKEQTVFGNKRVSWVTVVMGPTYATPGDTFTAAQCGLDVIDFIVPLGQITTTGGGTTAFAPGVSVTTNNTVGVIQAFGGAASGAALTESSSVGNTFSIQLLVFGA
jgi:hypothetical protein